MVRKNNLFLTKRTLNIRGRLHSLDRPVVMAILNASPDSFYSPSTLSTPAKQLPAAVDRAGYLLEQGADWLDIGGMSTRPGADLISDKEDTDRVVPVIEAISRAFPEVVLSVDTVYASTAKAALAAGAGVVNDVSAGSLDPDLWAAVAEARAPYILMHHKGVPASSDDSDVAHIGLEVYDFLAEQSFRCLQAGITDIILDPGFGFGKSLDDGYRLLASLHRFKTLELPLLVGISRKSMVNKALGITASESLNATTVLNTLALTQGASLLRVHDPKPAREAVLLWERFKKAAEQNEFSPEEKPAFRG